MKISRTIMVSNNTAHIDTPIYLYKGDGNVLISLDIINITISTKLNQMSTTSCINDDISYATACLCKKDSSSTFHIVGTKVNDKIELELKKDMIDETVEVGEYRMQVHLFDKENNRLTIPVVEEINIMLPLCSDDYVPPVVHSSKIGEATVDYSKVASENISAFSDSYHTYNWTTGEYITANKLNNMITGIDETLYDIKNIQNNYVTKSELNNKANKNEIPTKVSQLLNDKGYLTEHQDLSNYATKSYVDSEIANAQLEGGEVDLSGYATKDELNNKADIKDIPTKVSQLENDSKFLTSVPSEYITETELNNKDFATKDELNEKANINDVPTKLSDLQNDTNFITSIPSEYITDTELNEKGYLTEHQSLDNYATKTYVKNEIANAQLGGGDTEIDLSGFATKDELNNKADINDIPTKVSQLENDNKYLTSVPSEYITESELNSKGYLTEHQDLSGYATKDELNNKVDIDDIPTKISDLQNDMNFISSIPSEYVTDTELNQKGYLTEHQSLDNYVTKDELNNKADKSSIPTKVSQLQNDSNFLSSIPSEYITETELEEKKYLTEHQDLSNYATKDELHKHSNKTVLDIITEGMVSNWNNKSEFDGDYNSLINKPTIPSIEGLASEDYVNNAIENIDIPIVPTKLSEFTNDSNFISEIPSEYITETELNNKDFALKDDIPTKLSDLQNDKNFLTSIPSEYITDTELNEKGYLTEHQSLDNYVTKNELNAKANINDIPTKVSELQNDSNFLSSIPSEYVTDTELNQKGYLTEHQSLDGYATKNELNNKADKSSIPTKISDLQNDTNFLSSIPSEYVTETELNDKGYLTEHQDLSGYLVSNTILRIEVVDDLPEIEEEGVLYICKTYISDDSNNNDPETPTTKTNLYYQTEKKDYTSSSSGYQYTFDTDNTFVLNTTDGALSKDINKKSNTFNIQLESKKLYKFKASYISGSATNKAKIFFENSTDSATRYAELELKNNMDNEVEFTVDSSISITGAISFYAYSGASYSNLKYSIEIFEV